jgi:putative CocE/NonD family hydrolase
LRGGIFANWGTGPERTIEEDLQQNAPVDDDKDGSLLRAAADEHRRNTNIYAMWKSIPYRDGWSDLTGSQFWLETNVASYRGQFAQSKVAVYTQGGWNDDFRAQGLIAYQNLKNPKKILIGPWEHCRTDNFDLMAEYLRFFDHWLKNIDNGIMNEPPIRYYTVNAPKGQEWKFANQWPLPQAKSTAFYLQPGKDKQGLSTTAGKPAQLSQPVNYEMSCGQRWPLLTQTCAQDEKGNVFTSETLSVDTEVTGHPLMTLWISSTASDGNFFAYLEDVAPDGKVAIVTDGRLRASLRKTTAAPYDVFGLPWHRSLESDVELLTPNQPTELRFDMLPISYIFKAGHRLRVNVTGADHRERDRAVPITIPTMTIYGGGKYASMISLPVIPAGR